MRRFDSSRGHSRFESPGFRRGDNRSAKKALVIACCLLYLLPHARLAALDLAIGLIFLYVVLALVCSTINEAVAVVVGLRRASCRSGASTS